jgi:hypothetical protein
MMRLLATAVTVNPMVEYLNSLRTQQQGSNSTYIHEARRDFLASLKQKSPWFPDENDLYVRTRLDALVDDLVEGTKRVRLLFLTGDAGDGKTALCAALARRLGFEGELQWETQIQRWRIIKDASEVEEVVLAALIEGQLEESPPKGLIVAINEGRLRRLFRSLSAEARELWQEIVEPALEGWLDSERAKALDEAMTRERVLVVNFRHRFHVRTVTPDLLKTWTPQSLWEHSPACDTCPARARCPILANVQDLRSTLAQKRATDVLAYAHFSGQRLPFRRLQAVLAMMTTGGLNCADVQSSALADEPMLKLLPHRFYNALFLRDELRKPVAVRPEPMARSFAGADPAGFVRPPLDRRIRNLLDPSEKDPEWDAPHTIPPIEAEAIRSMRKQLNPRGLAVDLRDLQTDLSNLTRSLRRWAMFVDDTPPGMGWRHALELVESYAEGGTADALQRTVVEAINRLHGVDELRTETITGNQIDAAGFRTPARQVLELNLGTDFSCGLRRGPALPDAVKPYLESAPTEIFLTAWPREANVEPAVLRLDARLVEILLSVAAGFAAWQGLGAYRRALARFHARLSALAWRARHQPLVTIRAAEKRYSVSVDASRDHPRIRFEGQD